MNTSETPTRAEKEASLKGAKGAKVKVMNTSETPTRAEKAVKSARMRMQNNTTKFRSGFPSFLFLVGWCSLGGWPSQPCPEMKIEMGSNGQKWAAMGRNRNGQKFNFDLHVPHGPMLPHVPHVGSHGK